MESNNYENKSRSSSFNVTFFPLGSLNPKSKITGELFNRRNYSEWSYSAELALDGTSRLGYADGTIAKIPKDNQKYVEWKAAKMLIMSWIYNSMEGNISRSFRYCKAAKEFRFQLKTQIKR